jgi:ATP dependent DNA ligase domain
MLWSAHNSLKGICSKICDPEFAKARDMIEMRDGSNTSGGQNSNNEETVGLSSYMPQSLVAPQFGVVFSPMLSERTGFGRILNDISHRHRDYILSDDARKQYPNIPTDCLAFQHPTFCVEPKLDGERFIVHVSRDGIVKMHTRRGIWYSELYSPVLGPSIRRAVRKGYDVILDGEVIAWDSIREETVPFGSNRTVATLRTKWMARNGMLDSRDRNMHDGDSNKSMNLANSFIDKSSTDMDVGDECWLQYIIFDLIYIDGPGANDLLNDTISEHILPRPSAGSIIHLDALERKTLLYNIINPQPREVEIVQTWIIRPNGRTDSGETYFSSTNPTMENGYVARKLDSLSYTLSGMIDDIRSVDTLRRYDRSDDQISEARALAIQHLYDITVEQQRLEGLVFKDLSTPYYLGEESKTTRYWHKFKPDYFNGSAASDLDLIVIGSYYASGLRNSGKPSSLLCACVDSEDPELFLPAVKVNLNSVDATESSELLKRTGYRKNDDSDDEDGTRVDNMWQKSDWAAKYYPEFISRKSFQPNNENNGWRAKKNDCKWLWYIEAIAFVLQFPIVIPNKTFYF